eukprot:scaffold923_cov256-Pinguiococcus_pyrenoidosus.AAC.58
METLIGWLIPRRRQECNSSEDPKGWKAKRLNPEAVRSKDRGGGKERRSGWTREAVGDAQSRHHGQI